MFGQKLSQNEHFKIQSKKDHYFTLYNIALDPSSNQASLFLIQNNSKQNNQQAQTKQILIAELSRVTGGIRSINLCLQFGVQEPIILLSIGGSIHIIGGYKKFNAVQTKTTHQKQKQQPTASTKAVKQAQMNDQNNLHKQKQKSVTNIVNNQKQVTPSVQQQVQSSTANQPLRRSTRARQQPPPKPIQNKTKAAKSQRRDQQHLQNLAKYFDCNLDEDEDDSFSNQMKEDEDESDSESDGDSQNKNQDSQSDSGQMKDIYKKGRKIRNKDPGTECSNNDEKNSVRSSKSAQKNLQAQTKSGLIDSFSVPTKNPYN